ncbi:MAG: endolytic transglycosylase MltG [bacterium]
MEKNRRAGIIKVLSLMVAASILLLLLMVILSEAHKKQPYTSSTVSIPRQAGVWQIASLLKSHRIIDYPLYFILRARLKGIENSLKGGKYRFNNRMTTGEILDCLTKGKMITYFFTIPEGYNLKEIAHRLQAKGFASSKRFLSLCCDRDFILSLGLKVESLEGYLFPGTYQTVKKINEKDIITVMVNRFKEISAKYQGRIKERNTSLHSVITLASLIEREVQKEEEKPLISAVFHNRLKKGMPLESCVTVLYALGYHKPHLTYNDLKIKSPYNTYLHHGLPPGPICSPGRTSIEAALNPAPVSYLFFVAQGNGFHQFSETYFQHRMAKRTDY